MTFNSKIFGSIILVFVIVFFQSKEAHSQKTNSTFGMVIHGGAGTILKKNMTPELEQAYQSKLKEALQTGYDILKNNGSSMDAVEATINILEDSPLFNAGKGAVFTGDGTHELDASIMDGRTLQAGAVASVKHVKNPITLARLVLEKSPHVMMVGAGAEEFAVQHNLERVSQYYFYTEKRWKSLQKRKESVEEKTTLVPEKENIKLADKEKGTVGAAALDKAGNLAAGTSTGGMTNKMFGRVGDSPIIGAGTYANNQTCAVSGTGHGEYFMRLLVSYDIHALMAYEGKSLKEAANTVIMKKLEELGGTGGIIAIDKDGNIAMPFNTDGMYRGYIRENGETVVKIYKN
ncbi:isoaspartyl peptidase/L-asparaginase [candidate division KSB1 bacterium]|nr:isoaspartyl peptidase/L-asparaginase [candidate division KSB1 bacterium]